VSCGVCSAETSDGIYLCGECNHDLADNLARVPGLLHDLELTLSRQTSKGDGGDGETPVFFDPVASEAMRVLLVWYRRRLWPPHVAGPMCCQPWAPTFARGLAGAVSRAVAAIDRPEPRLFVGWCPEPCGRGLYASSGALVMSCPGCGAVWDVAASREALLLAATGILVTVGVISRALGVPLSTIKGWVRQRRLISTGVDDNGHHLYALADAKRLINAADLIPRHRTPIL
jgi:hypothetical protein